MKIKNLNEIFNKCEENGIIKFKEETDTELIKSLRDMADKGYLYQRNV